MKVIAETVGHCLTCRECAQVLREWKRHTGSRSLLALRCFGLFGHPKTYNFRLQKDQYCGIRLKKVTKWSRTIPRSSQVERYTISEHPENWGVLGVLWGTHCLAKWLYNLRLWENTGYIYIYISISGWCFKNVRNQPRTTATTRDSAGDVSTYSLHKAHCTDDHFPVNALYQKWPVDQPFDPRGRCQVERHQ